ncbi:dystroglycan-like [Dorcoceras hygrometricum]|uniref:Dystroglycan-like n=1 Tax=Dorcoceras hygrometricum TaxID=472368 RepID=A0A2Z7BRE3_9LAMI|nr:dystroglycan-like [Dorcoceras hygrometricum]
MASSFYSNAQHVDFESVLSMDDHEMVSMFEALMASGLRGFLGCPTVVYEDALVDFFENASVRNGVIISTVGGQLVEISEELFAESFELPVDGLGDLSEMPKDAIFDARSIVSLSGEPISLSGRKNQKKMPFRLLCDILAKAIYVKAGSFNAITVEKFSLITAVVCRIKMNWAKVLFSILKKMVTPRSKQAKGFAIQVSLLLATFPSLELGESSEFPASKVLTKKTVHRFVSINDRDGAEEVTGAAKKKAVSKKRPAADVGAAVPKKKRTFKKKSISSISSLELVEVAEEAIPIQQVTEPSAVEEPRCSSADDVDLIIQQVLDETREAVAPADTAQPAVAEENLWFDLPYDDLVKQWEAERPVVTASDTDEDIATVDVAPADGDQQVQEFVAPISTEVTLSADEQMSLDDILLTIPVDIPLPSSCMEVTKITMGKSIKIPGVSQWAWFLNRLPRISAEDKGKDILVEKDPVKGNPAKEHYSLICADIELLVNLRAQVIYEVAKFFHSFSLKKLASINFEEMYKKEEQVLSWGETESPQEAIQRKFYILLKYRTVLVWKFLEAWRANFAPGQGSLAVDIQGARQEVRTLDDVHTIRFNEFRKNVLTQNASIFQGLADVRHFISGKHDRRLADVRHEVEAVNAKVDIMVSYVNAIQKDAEATKEALSHQLLEFQSSAQENHNVIHAQLSELVDYIHRGSADKKGESGSRGLQKPANTQKEGSAVTPTFEQRVQMAQRRIVKTVLDADANRALLESQDAAERDRERRRKEAKSLKRRRKD